VTPLNTFNPIKLVFAAIVGVCAVIFFLSTYFQVEQYERAVVTRFGKVVEVAEPGLHFKLPFVHSVAFLRTDIQNITMPVNREGKQESANTYTIDNQEVDIVFNLFFRIPPDKVAFVYENVQDFRARLFNMAVDRLKSEMGKVNATHVAEQRGKIRDAITKVLENDAKELGLVITDFQLTNIDYTPSFRKAVEAAASAKANVETREQERIQALKVAERVKIDAEGKANAAREDAKGKADATLAIAKADAEAIRLKGEAEAKAIKAQAEALAQNAKLVELRKAERWNGELPRQLLSGVVPFMQFNAPGEK
jgi:regulator of protease activity HflC (stomatin/prohibitin superfamily)